MECRIRSTKKILNENKLDKKTLINNIIDDACSSTETGLERTGSLGWTEEAGEEDWRMPNCL